MIGLSGTAHLLRRNRSSSFRMVTNYYFSPSHAGRERPQLHYTPGKHGGCNFGRHPCLGDSIIGHD
jgi:hypothetical protein